MNDIERRTLIGAAGIGAIAALSKAGPLNPPAGTVTGTGRTLDEVYNKIPTGLPNGSGDGRIPIPAGTGAFAISQPGSYVLMGNLSSTGNALVISASNVTVDLNGYQVSSTSTTSAAIISTGIISGIVLRNGIVRGGGTGVSFSSTANQGLIEDLTVIDSRTTGMGFGSARDWTIRRCRVLGTGATTTSTDGATSISGIVYSGSTGLIEDCTVSRTVFNGTGVPTFRGIYFNNASGTGNMVARCTVTHDAAVTAQGLTGAGAGLYRDNTTINCSWPINFSSSWINGGGNV